VLVSEAMLQQTQVSRVEPKFRAFVERFPTVEALASADESEVLAMWSGLGYYRRARSLHAAARTVMERFGGRVPREVGSLLKLKGVGRYTAGAIASIAFGERAAIVDGNVRRVVRRLWCDGRPTHDRDAERDDWARAGALAECAEDPGATNEALIELGATVCTPAAPTCGACPLAAGCAARRAGVAGEIPPPKRAPAKREVFHAAVLVEDPRGRLLVERRGERGLWAGMWQPVTIEGEGEHATRARIAREAGVSLRRGGAWRFTHATTHRTVRFAVYRGDPAGGGAPSRGEFRDPDELATLPLANPHRRILLGERPP
jgi:A/G-specific adenine glycosylase